MTGVMQQSMTTQQRYGNWRGSAWFCFVARHVRHLQHLEVNAAQHGKRQRAEYLGLMNAPATGASPTNVLDLQTSSLGRDGRGWNERKCRESPKATQPTRQAPERSCARNTATAIASVLLHACRNHCGTAWAPANTTTVPRKLRGFSSQRPVAANWADGVAIDEFRRVRLFEAVEAQYLDARGALHRLKHNDLLFPLCATIARHVADSNWQ